MATLQAAIVHSSMNVPPCQPNRSISEIERPIGEERREPRHEAGHKREARDQFDGAEEDDRRVQKPEMVEEEGGDPN